MNYLEYFDLAEEPYSYLKTNPRFFYNAPQYRYAKAILNDGIISKSAHLYLTGPVGSGKTTLLRVIQVDLTSGGDNLVFFTYAPRYLRSSHSFLKRLCQEMHIKTARAYVDMLDNFEAQIGRWTRAGKTPILLIDEAHKLTAPAFDFLQHIMNFVTDQRLLIVIILAGQVELEAKIRRKDELRSRMQAVSFSSLSLADAMELVKWRWQVASKRKSNPLPFTDDALREMQRIAVGLPRDICSLANRSLQFAFSENTHRVPGTLVVEAAKSLKMINNHGD